MVRARLARLRRARRGVLADGREARMTLRVLVLGGYGNFGGYVCRALAGDARIQLVVAGRGAAKAEAFALGLDAANPAEAAAVDIADPAAAIAACRPDLVIHTVGP